MRNKIINGCGWIDQRNGNAASVTVNNTSNNFGPDRWAGFGQGADGVFTLIGTKGTYDPAGKGMPSSIYMQTTTADASIGASQTYGLRYVVEGQDVASWRIGTAQAATVTLSFRVSSSKAGTHCVAFQNAASTRTYVATYTVNQANTWEFKSITLTMDTTGTWLTDNGQGIKLFWNMGCGTTFNAPAANSWQSGMYFAVAGAQSVIDTLNAVLVITDVQLEQGAGPSPFELRPVQTELALCQRYHQGGGSTAASIVAGGLNVCVFTGGLSIASGSLWRANLPFAVPMRATPTAAFSDGNGNLGKAYFNGANASISIYSAYPYSAAAVATAAATGTPDLNFFYALDAEL